MKKLMLLGLLGACLGAAPSAQALPFRFGFGIGVGPAYVGAPPVCPYGYYAYYPYACAPYGYYGPEWFVGGVFIGAGPWFHGFHPYPGFYGRPGYYGRGGYYGHSFRGGAWARGPAHYERGHFGGGYHGGYAHGGYARGGFRGGHR